ncbi:MAG: YegS/Rv2252/BmrU family lipid kinase [Anaerovoracaceae bacterium]|jgi:diacylglycerol kinase (ATP)
MKIKKVLLVYNPFAGNGLFKANLDRIIEMFQKKRILVVPVRADKPAYMNEMFQMAGEEGFSKVIAAGGDGTINIAVNTMLNNDVNLPLAVFPSGTANDFAYYFDIPHDIDNMVKIATEENYSCIDLGCVNGKYFINVAAMGFLVDVSQRTDPNIKNTLGVMSYYLKGVSEVPRLEPIPVKIESEEYSGTEKMYFMLVMNGRSAGGFRRIAPTARMDDGLLDVLLFREMPITELPGLLFNFIQGNHSENKNVIFFRTKKLRLETEADIGTDVDGEKGCEFPLEISCVPKVLRINTLRNDMEGSYW